MFEWIMRKLMTRIQVKRKRMDQYSGGICPIIQEKLERNKVVSRVCFPTYCGEFGV